MHRNSRIAVTAASVFFIAACAASPEANEQPANVPDDAIAIGENLYMVPLERDADGCMMYQALAPGKMVAQVIHYRTAEGEFVVNKEIAACMTDAEPAQE